MKTIAKTGIALAAIALLASCRYFSENGNTNDVSTVADTTISGISTDTSASTLTPSSTITGAAD